MWGCLECHTNIPNRKFIIWRTTFVPTVWKSLLWSLGLYFKELYLSIHFLSSSHSTSSSNHFSTTHLAGLCPLSVSKIVIGLSVDCPPHHSQLETKGRRCVDSLPFFTQYEWSASAKQLHLVSQVYNKITCKQRGLLHTAWTNKAKLFSKVAKSLLYK